MALNRDDLLRFNNPTTRKRYLRALMKVGKEKQAAGRVGVSLRVIREYCTRNSNFDFQCQTAINRYEYWLLEQSNDRIKGSPRFSNAQGKIYQIGTNHADNLLLARLKQHFPGQFNDKFVLEAPDGTQLFFDVEKLSVDDQKQLYLLLQKSKLQEQGNVIEIGKSNGRRP